MFKVINVKSGLISLKVIFLFLLPYLFTYVVEQEMKKRPSIAAPVFSLTSVYQKLITAGPRELRQNYTALVDINPEMDEDYQQAVQDIGSPCGKKGTRNGLALLLDKIAVHTPSEIVIDKYFPKACGDEDPGTAKLRETLQGISRQIPIVIGRLALDPTQVPEIKYSGTTPVLLASQASLKFGDNKQNIAEGIVNLDVDNRKLAIKWLVIPDEKSEPDKISTLSYAAANAYYHTQPELAKRYPGIQKLLERDKNPYISFIEPSKFELIPAGKLITAGSSDNFSRLRGKIVIIGESGNPSDMHDSVFNNNRKVPGFILQANYIEAMLDQRYYEPIPWLDYVIGFFVIVAVSFCEQNIRPTWKLAVFLGLILGGVFLLLYLSVALFGFYINPITMSGLAIAIVIMRQIFPKNQPFQKPAKKKIREL